MVTGGMQAGGHGGRSMTMAGSAAMSAWMVATILRQWSHRRSSRVPLIRRLAAVVQWSQRSRPGAHAHHHAGAGAVGDRWGQRVSFPAEAALFMAVMSDRVT